MYLNGCAPTVTGNFTASMKKRDKEYVSYANCGEEVANPYFEGESENIE